MVKPTNPNNWRSYSEQTFSFPLVLRVLVLFLGSGHLSSRHTYPEAIAATDTVITHCRTMTSRSRASETVVPFFQVNLLQRLVNAGKL